MNLAVIDIGGTTIKIATWKNQQLIDIHAIKTPNNREQFYEDLNNEVNKIRQSTSISGVAISSPGAVDQKTGIIGGSSAIPYIHNFKMVDELERRFKLPVAIENDANSAALGELADGSAKGCDSMAFFIIGTGVGGALIINKKIWHGAHLYGGEFGFMIIDGKQLSDLASPVAMAKRYNVRAHQNLTGKEVFALADQDDQIAKDERNKMIHALAVAMFDIQHSFDPEKIVIGGGISNNPKLIPLLSSQIKEIRKKMPNLTTIQPNLAICKLKSEANLRGAVANFIQNK